MEQPTDGLPGDDATDPDESQPQSGSKFSAPRGSRTESQIEDAFDRLVEEGAERLARPLLPQIATGLLGGVDVAVGVLIYLVVKKETGSSLLASLAFTIGFIVLLLARSELFTENFLVPVTARAAGRASWTALIRLWAITLVANLAGGLLMAAMIVEGRPDLRSEAVTTAAHYADLGITWRSLFLAVLAGVVITLMTRMQHATDEMGVKVVAAIAMPFVLVGAQLFHSILDSIFMFAGLVGGSATYSWLDWLGALGWSALGNMLGGVVLVTGIRLLRVPHRVEEERSATD
jgi:formate/nitrite transporter FocA (FNT family)